jgi:hypothetical protein
MNSMLFLKLCCLIWNYCLMNSYNGAILAILISLFKNLLWQVTCLLLTCMICFSFDLLIISSVMSNFSKMDSFSSLGEFFGLMTCIPSHFSCICDRQAFCLVQKKDNTRKTV